MKNRLVYLVLTGLCAVSLSGCLGAAPQGERTIRYSYCTSPDGKVVNDPAAAVQKGIALRCYNFMVD